MLLPALNKARQKAHTISCVSQLKQMGTFTAMYLDDFGTMMLCYKSACGHFDCMTNFTGCGVKHIGPGLLVVAGYIASPNPKDWKTNAISGDRRPKMFNCPSNPREDWTNFSNNADKQDYVYRRDNSTNAGDNNIAMFPNLGQMTRQVTFYCIGIKRDMNSAAPSHGDSGTYAKFDGSAGSFIQTPVRNADTVAARMKMLDDL